MRRLLQRLFAPQPRPVLLRSLLAAAPVAEAVCKERLRNGFTGEAVQALIQVLETDAAGLQAEALYPAIIAQGPAIHAFHAGGAAALLKVLDDLRAIRDSKKTAP